MAHLTYEPGTTVAIPNASGPFYVSVGANGFDAPNIEHVIAANEYGAIVSDALRKLEPGTAAAVAHGSLVVLVARVSGPQVTINQRFQVST